MAVACAARRLVAVVTFVAMQWAASARDRPGLLYIGSDDPQTLIQQIEQLDDNDDNFMDKSSIKWIKSHPTLIEELFEGHFSENASKLKEILLADANKPERNTADDSFEAQKRAQELTDSETMGEEPLTLKLTGRDGVMEFPAKRFASDCDHTRPTMNMLYEFLRTGKVCGMRASRQRYGIGK